MIEQPFVIVDGCNQTKRKMELKKQICISSQKCIIVN